jgi:hypothetical protein
MYAMDEAAQGEADLKAGAAEFCLILVETMEMGVSSLVAAAFHYCSCVRARQSHSLKKLGNNDDDKEFAAWEFRAHESLESFGGQALQIERDAARLNWKWWPARSSKTRATDVYLTRKQPIEWQGPSSLWIP